MKLLSALGAPLALATLAPSAEAAIIMVVPSSIQGQNILFNNGVQTATTVFGFTNRNPQQSLSFTSGGATLVANGGQARIGGDGVNLTQLQFELTNGGTFNDLELRLFGGDATTASFTIIDNAGDIFTFANQVISGAGRFGFLGIDGQSIRSVAFTVNNAGIQDVRQVRLDPAVSAVPEPATWAFMLLGFGAVGHAMRMRRRTRQIQTA